MTLYPHHPTVSVIMPAHNVGRFIAQAIQSVQRQTFTDWELIIIDDCSTDNTAEVVRSFLGDGRIRYQKAPHRLGCSSKGYNIGLRASKGAFIGFLDADDEYYPDALETLLNHLQSHADCTAVYGLNQRVNEQGEPITPIDPAVIEGEDGQYRFHESYQHTWDNIFQKRVAHQLQSLMMRRETFERVGFFVELFPVSEDFIYFLKLFMDNLEGVHCIPRLIFKYRINTGSITQSHAQVERILAAEPGFIRYVFETLPLPNEAKRYKVQATLARYRYWAWTQMRHGRLDMVYRVVLAALKNPMIPRTLWLQSCFPYLLRTMLPTSFDNQLRQAWRTLTSRRILAR